MQPLESSPIHNFNTFEQVIQLYRVTRDPSIQRKSTAIKTVHNKLVELIKQIVADSPSQAQTANSLAGMVKANIKPLKEANGIPRDQDTSIIFDVRGLKNTLTTTYEELKGEHNPSPGEFIKFLEDESEGTETKTRHTLIRPLTLQEQLNRDMANLPNAGNFAQVGYNYTRGVMGRSSNFMKSVLEGSDAEYAAPGDSDDLARCMFYLEDYLRLKNRNDLTPEEKERLSNQSGCWDGIVSNLAEFRAAIATNRPMAEVTERMRVCMNAGKAKYGNSTLSEAERAEIHNFIQNIPPAGNFDLSGRSRLFANTLLEVLHTIHREVYFEYNGAGAGTSHMTSGGNVRLIDRVEYNYPHRSFYYRLPNQNDRDNPLIQAQHH